MESGLRCSFVSRAEIDPASEAVAHQFVDKALSLAHEHSASDGQVAVEPCVPQAAAVGLHIDRQKAGLDSLGAGLQLQARAAQHRTLISPPSPCRGLGLHLGEEL